MRKTAVVLFVGSLMVTASAPRLEAKGCGVSRSVLNSGFGLAPKGGGIDLAGTSYASQGFPGPALRFWAYGAFDKANSGTQDQFNKEAATVWLQHPKVDAKLANAQETVWAIAQADWYGNDLTGCVWDTESKRTVVEISFADKGSEGTVGHQGFYMVMSAPWSNDLSAFDMDQVRGAGGLAGNVVPVQAIPAPQIVSATASGDHVVITVKLAALESFSEGGKGKPFELIQGVRVLYAVGDAPTSSAPGGYKPVMNPKSPSKPLGIVEAGGQVEVAVPSGKKSIWLVMQVAYADPAEIYSNAVSAHVGPVSPDGTVTKSDGGRSRK